MTRFNSIITLVISIFVLAVTSLQLFRAFALADTFILIMFLSLELLSILLVAISIRELLHQKQS